MRMEVTTFPKYQHRFIMIFVSRHWIDCGLKSDWELLVWFLERLFQQGYTSKVFKRLLLEHLRGKLGGFIASKVALFNLGAPLQRLYRHSVVGVQCLWLGKSRDDILFYFLSYPTLHLQLNDADIEFQLTRILRHQTIASTLIVLLEVLQMPFWIAIFQLFCQNRLSSSYLNKGRLCLQLNGKGAFGFLSLKDWLWTACKTKSISTGRYKLGLCSYLRRNLLCHNYTGWQILCFFGLRVMIQRGVGYPDEFFRLIPVLQLSDFFLLLPLLIDLTWIHFWCR